MQNYKLKNKYIFQMNMNIYEKEKIENKFYSLLIK